MATIKKFTSLASGQVNKGIYVWDCDGELLSSINTSFIKEKESGARSSKKTEAERKKQKAEWLADALEMYEKRKNVAGARAFDCSGFVGWALREVGVTKADRTAEGWRQQCSKVTKSQLKDGDLCFKVSDGKAHHVGIYVGGKIIEAKGRAYGVVSSSVSSSWNAFGRLNIKWDDEPKPEKPYNLTKVLKYGMGSKDNPDPAVKELQKRLKELGYPFPENKGGIDGIFRSWTDKIVRQFQVDKKIGVDGKVGQQTAKKLGWTWKQ